MLSAFTFEQLISCATWQLIDYMLSSSNCCQHLLCQSNWFPATCNLTTYSLSYVVSIYFRATDFLYNLTTYSLSYVVSIYFRATDFLCNLTTYSLSSSNCCQHLLSSNWFPATCNLTTYSNLTTLSYVVSIYFRATDFLCKPDNL